MKQSKMLKCAGNEDAITMKADDAGDVVAFLFESPGTSIHNEGVTDARAAKDDDAKRQTMTTRESQRRMTDDEARPG